MTRLLLARHAQTAWNRERRWQGQADPPLNRTGRAQARALARSLVGRGLDAIVTSDLARARQTAEIVAAALGLPLSLEPRLREVDVGEWAGLTSEQVAERFPAGYRRRLRGGTGWEQGESYEGMGLRVRAALVEIAASHPGGRVLVVTHGGPLRAVWLATGGSLAGWVRAGNCDIDEIAVEDGDMRWLDSSRGGLHQQIQG